MTEDTRPKDVDKSLGDAATLSYSGQAGGQQSSSNAPVPTLVVHSGPNLGDFFAFPEHAREIRVGRARDMDFCLRHASVSRCHAKLAMLDTDVGRSIEIQDMDSTNGTQVNGEELSNCVTLSDGDMVQIGEIALRYRVMDPAEHAFQADIAKRVESARTDPLTGLLTRRFLVDQLPALLDACRRNDEPFSMLIVDLDHFKRVNDHYGHIMGDQVLCSVARCLRKAIRGGDSALRFGGEEFCIILPGAPAAVAARVGERIREMIAELDFETNEGRTFSITTSVGAGEIHPEEKLPDWLERTDRALYVAKRNGRDRVHLAPEPSEESAQETVRRKDQSNLATQGVTAISRDDIAIAGAQELDELNGSMAQFARQLLQPDGSSSD